MYYYRVANFFDALSLAEIHYDCCKLQPGGFMYQLGKPALFVYYKILIQEKHSHILVAEDLNGKIIGFVSGTSKAEEHLQNLKNKKYKFILPIILAIIYKPKIINDLFLRYSFISSGGKKNKLVVSNGARVEYWGFLPNLKSNVAIDLFKLWISNMFSFGYDNIKGEVDIINKNIINIHRILGAQVIGKMTLKDDRTRVIIQYKK